MNMNGSEGGNHEYRYVPEDVISPRIEYYSILQLTTQDSFVIEVDSNCTAFLNGYLATDGYYQRPYFPTRPGMYQND